MSRHQRPNRYDRICSSIDAYFQPRVQAAYDYVWNRWGLYLGTVKFANIIIQVLLMMLFVGLLEFTYPIVKLVMFVTLTAVLGWTLSKEGRIYVGNDRRFQRIGDYESLNRVVDYLPAGVMGWHGFAPSTVATAILMFLIQQWKSALAYVALIAIMSLLGYLRRVYVHGREPTGSAASA